MTADKETNRPQLIWRDNNVPESATYGDFYYAPQDGLAETRHVFLHGIGAPDIWQDRAHFTIGETGFGTGLNFLATWHLWRQTAPAGSCLHYVSAEKHPLNHADLARALSPWADLTPEVAALLAQYPDLPNGYHRLIFQEGRVSLTLLIGDCATQFAALNTPLDAWYLDGFSPAKNPDMWCDAVYQQLGRLAHTGTRLATFTAAGHVRRGLTAAGFQMEKTTGFGHKRERLVGSYIAHKPVRTAFSSRDKPWFRRPPPLKPQARIAILGAGIAGLTLARRLKQLGFHPEVFEQQDHIMAASSGNPAAMLDLYVAAGKNVAQQLGLRAYLFALRHYHSLMQDSGIDLFHPSGLVKFPKDAKQAENLRKALRQSPLSAAQLRTATAEDIQQAGGAAVPPYEPVLFLPQAGYLFPHKIGTVLSQGISVHLGTSIHHLQPVADNTGTTMWQLCDQQGNILSTVDAVVLTSGADTARMPQASSLPLRFSRGQINYLPANAQSQSQQHILSGKGYILPPISDPEGRSFHVLGATYDKLQGDAPSPLAPVTIEGQMDIAERLKEAASPLHFTFGDTALSGRTSIRTYLPDHLPLCGPLPVVTQYQQDYADLHHGRLGPIYPAPTYYSGLYVLGGLSARGFTTAPLLAEIMCNLMTGSPLPVERAIADALHPARFIIRDLIRRQ